MRAPVSTAIAISVGLIILISTLFPLPFLVPIRVTLIQWAVILAAVAGLIAIINLLGVHWRKLTSKRNRDVYSIFFLIAFILTLAAGLLLGPAHPLFQKIITSIQVPIEASLMGVLTISLAFASVRLFQKRRGLLAFTFAFSALIFLIVGSGFLSIGAGIPLVSELLAAINSLPIAGARGILLGIALGGITTGLRILIGADRPYSG